MNRFKILFAIILLAAGTVNAQENPKEKSVNITVDIEGRLPAEGKLRLQIFDSESNWLKKEVKVLYIDLTKENSRTFKVEALPAGTYAMSVIHDKNDNGELDMGMMGPTERYGFSNNARGSFGPASFIDAAMIIDSDTKTTIKL